MYSTAPEPQQVTELSLAPGGSFGLPLRRTARKLRKAGMDILVCTPEKLAECMAQIIRG